MSSARKESTQEGRIFTASGEIHDTTPKWRSKLQRLKVNAVAVAALITLTGGLAGSLIKIWGFADLLPSSDSSVVETKDTSDSISTTEGANAQASQEHLPSMAPPEETGTSPRTEPPQVKVQVSPAQPPPAAPALPAKVDPAPAKAGTAPANIGPLPTKADSPPISAGMSTKTDDSEESPGKDQPLDKGKKYKELNLANYYSFIIGSQNYEGGYGLRYVENDAHELRSVLVDSGYAVTNISSHINARLEDFTKALTRWLDRRDAHDSIMVYLAGHGVSIDGVGHYIPVDADIMLFVEDDKEKLALLAQQSFSLVKLARLLDRSSAKDKLLVLDLCSPETTRLAAAIGAVQASAVQLLPPSARQPNSTFATLASCRDDEMSYESSELRHGVFSYWLIRGLSGHADRHRFGNEDGMVKLMEAKDYVYENVLEYGTVRGMIQHPILVGHRLEGPFFLTNWSDETRLPDVWTPEDTEDRE